MRTAATLAPAQRGDAIDQIAGFLARPHQIVGERDMNGPPAGRAEEYEHGIAPTFAEGVGQAAELRPIFRSGIRNRELDVTDLGDVALELSPSSAAQRL